MIMKKTRIIILGAGISGLTLAHYLPPSCEVVILEKEDRAGGVLQTEQSAGFFFEKGPRTFQASRSGALLSLIQELGLEEELLFSKPGASKRYLWTEGKLHALPGFLTAPWRMGLLCALLKEWRVPPCAEEESVWDFACRRFNPTVAEMLFDPMVLGVFAGDCKALSMSACFPGIKAWEQKHGSLTKAFLSKRKKSARGLFSLIGGVETLTDALVAGQKAEILFNQEVQALRFDRNQVEVVTSNRTYAADLVFSALPPDVLGKLFQPIDEVVSQALLSIEMQKIAAVNVGYRKNVLPVRGFGYLVPTREKEAVLGVVFDSEIFPQQNNFSSETRLTVMTRGEVSIAIETLQRHLGISEPPDVIHATRAVIPQYTLGHQKKIAALEERQELLFPRCRLLGNYLSGVSVNDCIARAKLESEEGMSVISQ
jgi:oxygen-dependent protoporphyrinogen oxidase